MNINTAYGMTNFILNKTQTANATPARFNLAVNMANKSLFKRYAGIPEITAKGGNAITFSESTDVESVMRLFKQTVTLYISNTGLVSVPSDFVRESTLTYKMQKNGVISYPPIDIVNDAEWQEANDSYLVAPDKENPIARFIGTQIEFRPLNLVNAQLTYLRMPVTPVYGFTLSSNRPVYDAGTSVDIEFPDPVVDDFIMLTVQFLGVNAQRQDIVAYSQEFKMQGQ